MHLNTCCFGQGHVGSQFNFAGDHFNSIRETFAADGLTSKSEDGLRAKQLEAVELIAAWQSAAPQGTNGAKYFMNLAGVPVGDGRLPTIPLDEDAKDKLKSNFDAFCASSSMTKLHMCRKQCVLMLPYFIEFL